MKKDVLQLPEGYGLKAVIDLQKNKKQAFAVNLCALLIAAVMVFIAAHIQDRSQAWLSCALLLPGWWPIYYCMSWYTGFFSIYSAAASLFMVFRDYMLMREATLFIAEATIL